MKKLLSALLALCLFLPAGAAALELSSGEFALAQYAPYILTFTDTYAYQLNRHDYPRSYLRWYGAGEDGAMTTCAIDYTANLCEYAEGGILYQWDAGANNAVAVVYTPGVYDAMLDVWSSELIALTPAAPVTFEDVAQDVAACELEWEDETGRRYSALMTIDPLTRQMIQYELIRHTDLLDEPVLSVVATRAPGDLVPETMRALAALPKCALTLHYPDGTEQALNAPSGIALGLVGEKGPLPLYADAALTEPFTRLAEGTDAAHVYVGKAPD